jgi:hypothetical protein
MKASLVILIALVIVVLVVILWTSPTCRNAVTGVFNKKVEKKVAPVAKPPAPIVDAVAQPIRHGFNAQAGLPVATPIQTEAPVPVPQTAPAPEAPARRLTGNLFELFNPSVDVQAEYGLSEEQLEVMAREYKAKHLDTPKPEVLRSRHLTRSGLERAEQVGRKSFMTSAGSGKRLDSDQLVTDVLRDHLAPQQAVHNVKVRGVRKV